MAFPSAHLPTEQAPNTHNREITQALAELHSRAALVVSLLARNRFEQATIDRLLNRVAIDAARCADLTLAQFAECNGGESGVA